jgi:hypothetical protein
MAVLGMGADDVVALTEIPVLAALPSIQTS